MSVDIIYKILELVSWFFFKLFYNRKGSRWLNVDFLGCVVVDESDGFLNNREAAVCTPAGTGVLDPDGVRVLYRKNKLFKKLNLFFLNLTIFQLKTKLF